MLGIFKDVRFTHIEFWPFGPPYFLDAVSRTMEVGAQKESQEELPGMKNKRKQRKQHREENQDKEIKQQRKTLGAGQTI